MTQLSGMVEKGWGYEEIWATNDKYCGKIMHFNGGTKFSMHFHAQKDESWYVLSGVFQLVTINTQNASMTTEFLRAGESRRIMPLTPHRLICLEEGSIMEISTPDSVEDNYRVLPGDSQNNVYSS